MQSLSKRRDIVCAVFLVLDELFTDLRLCQDEFGWI